MTRTKTSNTILDSVSALFAFIRFQIRDSHLYRIIHSLLILVGLLFRPLKISKPENKRDGAPRDRSINEAIVRIVAYARGLLPAVAKTRGA